MKWVVVLLILLIIPLVSAQEDMYDKDGLTIDLDITGSFDIRSTDDDWELDYVKTRLFFQPISDDRMEVVDVTTEPSTVKNDSVYVFEWIDLDLNDTLKLNFSLAATVKTKTIHKTYTDKIAFPLKEDISDELQKYLQQTKTVDYAKREIRELATDLAEGEDDLYVVVNKMGIWVKQNIEYSLSTVTELASKEASWVLLNRIGVCDELTNLFIALVRSVGLPARFVSGIAYTNSELFDERWGTHGWAEVYFPGEGWIPFDVTYGQLGWLDPSHIKLKESLDATEPSVKYEWRAREVDVDSDPLDITASVEKVGNTVDYGIGIKATVVKEAVGIGSTNIIEAEIENLNDYYKTTEVFLAQTENLEVLDDLVKDVILLPNAKKKIFWKVKVNDTLDEDYKYTFPIIVHNQRNVTSKAEFIVEKNNPVFSLTDADQLEESLGVQDDKNYVSEFTMSCKADKDATASAAGMAIRCDLGNKGNTRVSDIHVCAQEVCSFVALEIGEKFELTLQLENLPPGKNDILVRAKTDDLLETDTVVFDLQDAPIAILQKVEAPEQVNFSDTFDITLFIRKESFSDIENISVAFKGDLNKEWLIKKLAQNHQYAIAVPASHLKVGKNTIEIELKYFDEDDKVHKSSQTIEITLSVADWKEKMKVFVNRVGLWLENFVSLNKKVQNL